MSFFFRWLNSSPPERNGRRLADGIFTWILNKKDKITIQISLKFVLRSPIDKIAVLFQVTGCRRTGDKPIPEPLLTRFTDAYMRH